MLKIVTILNEQSHKKFKNKLFQTVLSELNGGVQLKKHQTFITLMRWLLLFDTLHTLTLLHDTLENAHFIDVSNIYNCSFIICNVKKPPNHYKLDGI